MLKIALRWTIPAVALLVLGPAIWTQVIALRASDGGPDVSLLLNSSPAAGVIALALMLVAAIAVGALASRVFGPRPGLSAAGFIVAWTAWGTGSTTPILRAAQGGGTLLALALEGALVAAAGLVIVSVCFHSAAKNGRDPSPDHILVGLRKSLTTTSGLVGTLGGLVLAAVVVWFVARTGLRGQAIFASILAGVLAGAGAKTIGDSFDEHDAAPAVAAFLSMLLLAIVAPLSGFIRPGASALSEAALAGNLPGLLHLQPLDWLAGALIGVPMGFTWIGIVLEHHHEHDAEGNSKPASA